MNDIAAVFAIIIVLAPVGFVLYGMLRDMAEIENQYASDVTKVRGDAVKIADNFLCSFQPVRRCVRVLETSGPHTDEFSGRVTQAVRVFEEDPGWVVVKGAMPEVGDWVTLVVDPVWSPYVDCTGEGDKQ